MASLTAIANLSLPTNTVLLLDTYPTLNDGNFHWRFACPRVNICLKPQTQCTQIRRFIFGCSKVTRRVGSVANILGAAAAMNFAASNTEASSERSVHSVTCQSMRMAEEVLLLLILSWLHRRRRSRLGYWVHSINQKRNTCGEYHHLMAGILSDEEKYLKYIHMALHISVPVGQNWTPHRESSYQFPETPVSKRAFDHQFEVRSFENFTNVG